MTNEHIENLARQLGVELRLDPSLPFIRSALKLQGDRHTGAIKRWWVEAPGAVAEDGYMATLHELGHAAYFAQNGMRIEIENLRVSLDDYSSLFGRPQPTPYELEQEAFAHRWSIEHAEPGVNTDPPSMRVALSSYLVAAKPEELTDSRAADFMRLITEFGVKEADFNDWMKGRCPGCGEIHD